MSDIDLFVELKKKIIDKKIKIVLPESEDERIYSAAIRLAKENLVIPIFIGNAENLSFDEKTYGIEIIDPENYNKYDEMLEKLLERRKNKITKEEAKKLLRDPNYFSTMLVYMGEADGLVSGATHSTTDTVKPALQIIKTKAGVNRAFGYFVMLKGEEKYIMADCAINPNPSSENLAEFAIESASIARNFGIDPKIGMLSFSTNGSAVTEETKKIREAVRIANEKNPNLLIDGEMQFDSAYVPKVATMKYPTSTIAGKVNIFIFPDLNSGNIGYKIFQRVGGFEALGPFLAGLKLPVNDLSRGCNSEDVYKTVIVTAMQTLIL